MLNKHFFYYPILIHSGANYREGNTFLLDIEIRRTILNGSKVAKTKMFSKIRYQRVIEEFE